MSAKQTSPIGWLIVLALIVLSACGQADGSDTAVAPTDTAANTTAVDTAVNATSPANQPLDTLATSTPSNPVTSTQTTLTVWVPPDIITLNDSSRAVFNNQLLAFDAAYPDVDLVFEQKVVAGQGGILSYLRTGRNVAPDILPDLIALPTDQAVIAANEGLIFPLVNESITTAVDDLYPAAQEMAIQNEAIIAYPFAITNLVHFAADPTVITNTVGATWADAFADNEPSLVFPAAGRQGALLALSLYLDAGGAITSEAGQATLDAEPLVAALELLSNGRNNGAIQLQSSNVTDLDETWQQFELGATDLIQTTASQFLIRRSQETPPSFSAAPGINGPLPPLVSGWAWAVTSVEPDQRPLAEELLALLIEPAFLSEWSQAGAILPARQSAFANWPTDDPYVDFLQSELNRALPNPVSANSNVMLAMGNAVFNVISLSASPTAAAEEAIQLLQP